MSSFSERFALERVGDSGVCLDLESGNFFSLNQTAFEICGALATGMALSRIKKELMSQHSLSAKKAECALAAVLGQLRSDHPQGPSSPLTFTEASKAGRGSLRGMRRDMHWNGSPILEIAGPSQRLRWIGSDGATATERAEWLRVAVPHLLVAAGQPVLHASAITLATGALAFCGPSGSGKSTCAKSLEELGMAPLSEDLLVLSTRLHQPAAFVSGEKVLRAWSAEKGRRMAARGDCAAGLRKLIKAFHGPTAPLSLIVFLDRERRGGTRVALDPLSKIEALGELLKNGFGECGSEQVWLELLQFSRALAETVPAARATVPEGLSALRGALADLESQLQVIALGAG